MGTDEREPNQALRLTALLRAAAREGQRWPPKTMCPERRNNLARLVRAVCWTLACSGAILVIPALVALPVALWTGRCPLWAVPLVVMAGLGAVVCLLLVPLALVLGHVSPADRPATFLPGRQRAAVAIAAWVVLGTGVGVAVLEDPRWSGWARDMAHLWTAMSIYVWLALLLLAYLGERMAARTGGGQHAPAADAASPGAPSSHPSTQHS